MHLFQPCERWLVGGSDAISTSSKVAWIDRYRFRLAVLLPDMSPLDAATTAIDAFSFEYSHVVSPEEAAEAYAAQKSKAPVLRSVARIY